MDYMKNLGKDNRIEKMKLFSEFKLVYIKHDSIFKHKEWVRELEQGYTNFWYFHSNEEKIIISSKRVTSIR